MKTQTTLQSLIADRWIGREPSAALASATRRVAPRRD